MEKKKKIIIDFEFILKSSETFLNESKSNQCNVKTRYTFIHKGILSWPITFLFVHLLWSGLQKKGINNIKKLAENNPSFMYPKAKNS